MNANKFEYVSCCICGANDTDKICERGQFGLPTHVVICKSCGLSYLNPRWTKERYIHFYEKEYDKYYRPNVTKNTLRKGINYYQPVYERIQNNHLFPKKMTHILDIGSGDGNNLEYFMERITDADYYAIEPSAECRKTLESMGVKMLGSDIDINFEAEYEGVFDVIIMRHVLEHFANPVAAMEKVRTLLKDDGIVYIAVPNNLKFGDSKLLDSWFRVVHTYYFNRYSLENIFKKAGIKPILLQAGDEHNQKELFVIASKGVTDDILIDRTHYQLQKQAFNDKLHQEKKLLQKIKRIMKNSIFVRG